MLDLNLGSQEEDDDVNKPIAPCCIESCRTCRWLAICLRQRRRGWLRLGRFAIRAGCPVSAEPALDLSAGESGKHRRRVAWDGLWAQREWPVLPIRRCRQVDALAELDQLKPVCKALGRRATLELFEAADHSFHVPARSGRKDAEVLGEMLDLLNGWIDKIIARPAQ